MVLLTRKPGERVVIGGVVVEVLEVLGQRVRLGVLAPAGTSVRRGEAPALRSGPALAGAPASARALP
jgi:carbon storage regulator CsrA